MLPLSLGADCHDGIEPGGFRTSLGRLFREMNAFVKTDAPEQMIEQSSIGGRCVSPS